MAQKSGLIHIGTAGWQIRSEHVSHFDAAPSVLARYATRLCAVEINSSFKRPHRAQTYARWAGSVPPAFRFSVKMPRAITHELRLRDCAEALDRFLGEACALGDRLGPLLIQLPPKLELDIHAADDFFALFRERYAGLAVCEPRHASWFGENADALLRQHRIARVAADPPPVPGADSPGGWEGLGYYRLHGSPRIYYSNYESDILPPLARKLAALAASGRDAWCVFDNTARGAATANALQLLEHVGAGAG
jgi:uncharacterized protein YecE (DUF72 family)